MPLTLPDASFTDAAETRRRELPASVALVILTGGLAAAIMGSGGGAVGWAAVMALILIIDAELYRRLDAADRRMQGALLVGLSAWAFAGSAFYALLPVALWFDGAAAGAAAAIVLWVAGVVRHCGPGVSGALPIAVSGAAPPALSLLFSPLMIAAATVRPDWDAAVIAAIGGGALMIYVTQARLSAVEAERALRAGKGGEDVGQTLAQLMFDHGAFAAVLVDTQGRIVAMNRGMRQGLGVGDPVGRQIEDIVPWSPEHWRSAVAQALKGETVVFEEDEVRTPRGLQWFAWEVRPWRGADGAICGALSHGRSITTLVQARKAAAENEQYLKLALDAGSSVVWEIDFKTNAVTWHGDPRPLYGGAISYEEFMHGTTPILHDDDRDMIAKYFEDVAAGVDSSIEHRVIRGDNDCGWVQISARRVLGRSGGVRKLVVLSKDVTERKQQEAAFIAAMRRAEDTLKAKRALFGGAASRYGGEDRENDVSVTEMYERLDALMEEMDARDVVLADTMASLRAAREAAEAASVSKSQFLASMSHELRTPLNAIIGYSEILQEEAQADGRDSDMADIDRVLTAARQLLYLINDILDLSKIEAGRMDVAASDFELGGLIEEAAATVRPSVEKNGNRLLVEIDPRLGAAHSDSFKLNQCLLNLLSNAAKFTRDGEIVLRARREERHGDEWIELSVVDSGIGLSEEQVSRLFTAFVQADASTARHYGGTGLGLAITQKVMQLLGGYVSVSSTLGKGSTFTLSLPACAPMGATAAHAQSAPAIRDGAARMVLVIDDEESARDLAGRSLARLGFDVRGAINGAQGLAQARATRPSLIVLDIKLPDMSGWDVLAALAHAPETANIPVIVHSVDDDRQRARNAGACDLLVKPADRDVLAAAALRYARAPEVSAPAAPDHAPITKTA